MADNARKKKGGDFNHRRAIGGLWDVMGPMQISFLQSRGMRPEDYLVDIGAGSLRLGCHAIPFLDPGHYFAFDQNADLLKAGWHKELDDASRARTPRHHLRQIEDFDFSFLPCRMTFGMAQSVFTHTPFNLLRRCLRNAEPHFARGGQLFVTYFLCPDEYRLEEPMEHPPGKVVTFDHKNPYHYRQSDLHYAAAETRWRAELVPEWKHPRGQDMVAYTLR